MPHIFISYARLDGAERAERLYHALQARSIPAWRDTHNLDPYADFGGEIESALDGCTHVAVLVTPDVRRTDSFVRPEVRPLARPVHRSSSQRAGRTQLPPFFRCRSVVAYP